MTIEQLDRANELTRQIEQIKNTLNHMGEVNDFKLIPMTRQSGIYLRFGTSESEPIVHLSEGEALCIKNALESQIAILQHEFDRL